MKNRSEAQVHWLRSLRAATNDLPLAHAPRPYWSQKQEGESHSGLLDLTGAARAVRQLVDELAAEHLFAQKLGYDCVDGAGDPVRDPADELEYRVGKGRLWTESPESWTEADLCDFIEVFHDLAARPSQLRYHDYAQCGWHPSAFSTRSGRVLYRWRTNEVLARSSLALRLADEGEDAGRMVRAAPDGLQRLIDDALKRVTEEEAEVAHAVALFRRRGATREEMRSAIVSLARILEIRRAQLKASLTSKDEGALFDLANRFDLRHRNAQQYSDYGDEFLEWIFYWYLATVTLARRLDDR